MNNSWNEKSPVLTQLSPLPTTLIVREIGLLIPVVHHSKLIMLAIIIQLKVTPKDKALIVKIGSPVLKSEGGSHGHSHNLKYQFYDQYGHSAKEVTSLKHVSQNNPTTNFSSSTHGSMRKDGL